MTAAEEGLLLLCSRLGQAESRPLTIPQLRDLHLRVRASAQRGDPLRDLTRQDLLSLGCTEEQSQRILSLLNRQAQLARYLGAGEALDIHPITRLSSAYPRRILQPLGWNSPPILFYRGDLRLLEQPAVAVVGSRRLNPENAAFARTAGRLAAREGLVLVSGGAAGADMTAQNACLDAGGSCVIFVADELTRHPPQPRTLYLSVEGYDLPFSAYRALSRNHLIHIQGSKVLVAQCTFGSGGTWQGCLENLRHGWSPIFLYDDGSSAVQALADRGADPLASLTAIGPLCRRQISLF